MNTKPGSHRVRTGKPCLGKQRRLALAPEMEQSPEAARQQRCKCLGNNSALQARAVAIVQLGRASKIDTESDRNPIAASFKQYSGKLLAQKHEVIWPFEHQRQSRQRNIDCLDERKRCCKGQALRRRISWSKINERAPVEIPFRRDPGPALAAATGELVESH